MAARTPESTGCQAHTAVAPPGEASLEAYRHEKLQLADVLLSLLHIAEARRMVSAANRSVGFRRG